MGHIIHMSENEPEYQESSATDQDLLYESVWQGLPRGFKEF